METTLTQNIWTKSKLLIKAGTIGAVILLLQIPAYYVQNLIEEREARQKEAVAEVSGKWAGRQNLIGPVLVVPYWETTNAAGISPNKTKHLAYFLPDEYSVNASVKPQEKYRGIYKVMLYSSSINLSGTFRSIQPQRLGILASDMIWNEAYLRMSVSDTKGLSDEIKLNVKDSLLTVLPLDSDNPKDRGFYAPLQLSSLQDAENLRFSSQIGLNGSDQLLFTPVGKATTVNISSAWPHPSFTGNSLPQTTTVKDNGFTANWRSMGQKQNYPQQWKDDIYKLVNPSLGNNVAASAFGVDLFVPVNGYQKTMRSVKYSLLCLLLTFAAFFLIETTAKKSAHPFHYGLIGLALILFYTLLLSFFEYTGFDGAYIIASIFTVSLIGWFSQSVLASRRLAVLVSTVLVLLYGYVFTILQLQDYSLLLGSLGLFVTLAVIMQFSKKIQW